MFFAGDRMCDHHIDWSIFSLGKVVHIFMLSGIKPVLFMIFHKHEQMILFFCQLVQYMRESCCSKNDVDDRPMHEPINISIYALNGFSRKKAYAYIDL